MFEFNRQIVNHFNNYRTQPKNSANTIAKNLHELFDGTELHAYGKIIDTFEGYQAVQDLLAYINTIQPTNTLRHSKTLDKAAQLIAEQKGSLGKTDNQKPKLIFQKIQKFGKVNGKIGELISLAASIPQEIATYFILDDGLHSRKRRRMLFDPAYRFIGIGHAAHKEHQFITVILLAEQLKQTDTYDLENSRINSSKKIISQKQINNQDSKIINQDNRIYNQESGINRESSFRQFY